jgi:hypothetical protein
MFFLGLQNSVQILDKPRPTRPHTTMRRREEKQAQTKLLKK